MSKKKKVKKEKKPEIVIKIEVSNDTSRTTPQEDNYDFHRRFEY